jgi:hypothetical protein
MPTRVQDLLRAKQDRAVVDAIVMKLNHFAKANSPSAQPKVDPLPPEDRSENAEAVSPGIDPSPDSPTDLSPDSPTDQPPATPLDKCLEAYASARKAAQASGERIYGINDAGEAAYRRAMPPLRGRANIREFIVCVTHGMLIKVISYPDATKLLYAAQVAYNATNSAKKLKNKPKTTPKLPTIADWEKSQALINKQLKERI